MVPRLALVRAVHALAAGGVVAYPTEGVWGLGCEPLNGHAFDRLLALKRRPLHKGVILIASDFAQVRPFVARLSESALQPALSSWPGPYTWLMPAAVGVPDYLTGGRDTLAVRVTAHPVAAALCSAYRGPIVSTSANISGRPAARNALRVRRSFGGALDALVPGETGGLTRPTPIRDLASGDLLRT